VRRHAWTIAAFLWGVAEGTLFFIVPDVLLSFIGLRRGLRASLSASLAAAVGASVGGVMLYLWSSAQPAAARDAVLAVPAISDAMAAKAQAAIQTQGWFIAALQGPLTSTPYKVYAIFAPSAIALAPFAAATVLVRLPRFLAVSLLSALGGHFLRARIPERWLTWALCAYWAVFYVLFFLRMPN
jgi:hypothetical protein